MTSCLLKEEVSTVTAWAQAPLDEESLYTPGCRLSRSLRRLAWAFLYCFVYYWLHNIGLVLSFTCVLHVFCFARSQHSWHGVWIGVYKLQALEQRPLGAMIELNTLDPTRKRIARCALGICGISPSFAACTSKAELEVRLGGESAYMQADKNSSPQRRCMRMPLRV